MIYLLQDCYKDEKGEYHDVLKIGYSSKPFKESRKSAYDTHNIGYKFLGEREGSQELENYLHRRFRTRFISGEWFKYDSEIIRLFNESTEDDITNIMTQDDLNEHIRYYILTKSIPKCKDLSDKYLSSLLKDIEFLSVTAPEYWDLEFDEKLIKSEILGVFSYVVSKEKEYFENLDFDSPDIKKLLEDCSLTVDQSKNFPSEDKINRFYGSLEENITKEEFVSLQEQRRKESKIILEGFNNLNQEQKIAYTQRLKAANQVLKYEKDFVGISKTTNLPVYNTLIEIANERAWEVSQKDYQDKISVTKSLGNQGFEVGIYKDENDKIASDFLDNHFYATGVFKEKMRIYCEFLDTYKDNPEIMEILSHKIINPRFKQFYDYFGTKGCSSRNYEEKNLLEAWGNDSKEEKLTKEIYLAFKVGDRYPVKDLKIMVREIYGRLGITKTPKATDLDRYFKLTKTRITLPDKTVVNGFKLESL